MWWRKVAGRLCKDRRSAMSKKLFLQAIIKFAFGVLLVGLLVFLPAGTINFFNGWLFMGVLFVPMFVAGFVMMVKNLIPYH